MAELVKGGLAGVLADIGVSIATSAIEVQRYANQRAEHLATILGQPGYQEALHAEGLNVALFAAGKEIEEADKLDAKLVHVLTTALAVMVRVLIV